MGESPKSLALAAGDCAVEGLGRLAGSVLLLVAAVLVVVWDAGSLVAPRVFEPRKPLIQEGH